jgi:hypothetical protein
MIGAIHADLDEVKAQVMALADCLERLASCQGIDRNTPRGLSLLAGHIVSDIDVIQRELEALADKPRKHGSK